MDTYKLHIKIGPHEFKAEGDKSIVTSQFEDFKELIGIRHLQSKGIKEKSIYEYDSAHKVIILKILPQRSENYIADAVFLILLGYRQLRSEEYVFATQVNKALRHSGIGVKRVDRELRDDINEDSIIKIGKTKGVCYKLTDKGILEAQEMINNILTQETQKETASTGPDKSKRG